MRRLLVLAILLLAPYASIVAQANLQKTKREAPPRAETKSSADTNSSQESENVVPVIDIRALALQNEEAAANRSPAMSISDQGVFGVRTIPFVAALLVSLVGTAAMMSTIGNPMSRKHTMPRSNQLERHEVSAVDAILAQAKLVLQEKIQGSSGRLALEFGTVEADDSAISLAKTFGRGQGEFHLLRRLESERKPYAWESQLKSTRQNHVSAKRLGVGRGEVELATSLRKLEESQIRKESRA
ncbi:MAG: hypothetical protein KF749_00410 [Bacteroidetes bacterium]|nr:hypothetical protein [Bacteroidota bacterium]MCW5895090.1 hypothetical protein [Bacteroidota bacterium]